MPEKQRVVILGGGFAGLVAAQTLKHSDAQITLIDKRNFHLFQPLLYQVATGSLSPGEIAAPLRSVLSRQKNAQVLMGEAADIDPDAQKITLKDGGVFSYEYLIVATGSQTSYYGNDQWRAEAPSLKTLEEATAIRHKILAAFEQAERAATEAEAREWLTFVIVGAGATGMELAGALAEIAQETLRHDFRNIHPQESRIFLLDGGTRVLASYPEDLSTKAEKLVTKLGVEVIKAALVTRIDEEGVTYKHGAEEIHLRARTVLWAGGVAATEFSKHVAERTKAETDRSGRMKVLPDLTLPHYPNIYLAGDLALVDDQQGKQLPGVAQVAIQEGHYAGKSVAARLKRQKALPAFHYFNKGDMAVIGRAAAVANIFGLHVSGVIAWLIWLFIHLMYIVQFQSRIIVFIQWGFEYLTFSRGARLITGDGVEAPLAQDPKARGQ